MLTLHTNCLIEEWYYSLRTVRPRTKQRKTGLNSFGLVRMYVTPYRIFRILFTSDLSIRYTDKLLVFRWVKILLLLQICFYWQKP